MCCADLLNLSHNLSYLPLALGSCKDTKGTTRSAPCLRVRTWDLSPLILPDWLVTGKTS